MGYRYLLSSIPIDPPGSRQARMGFLSLWVIDLIAAILFFVVPYAYEVNPVTVIFYLRFGSLGVVIAASLYAFLIMTIGNFIRDPWDGRFLYIVILLYILIVFNNVVLLLFGIAPLLRLF